MGGVQPPEVGTVVEVYRNLNRSGVAYSLRRRDTGRVVAYAGEVVVVGASFTVQDGGRRRARAQGRRNVHAWVRGRLVALDAGVAPAVVALGGSGQWRAGRYQPYELECFVDVASGRRLEVAGAVHLDSGGLRYLA